MAVKHPKLTYIEPGDRPKDKFTNFVDARRETVLVKDGELREVVRRCEAAITNLRRGQAVTAFEETKVAAGLLQNILRQNERCMVTWEEETTYKCDCDPNLGERCPDPKHDVEVKK